jgi:hypothetical protein
MMVVIVAIGVTLGGVIGYVVPGTGLARFLAESMIWIAAIAILAAPLLSARLRERLSTLSRI